MPKSVGTYIAPDGQDNFLRRLVDHVAGDAARATSGAEILAALAQASAGGDCIQTWTHAQHGWDRTSGDPTQSWEQSGGGFGGGQWGDDIESTGFYARDPQLQPDNGGRAYGGRSLADLKAAIGHGKIRFCKPCRIYVYGCDVSRHGSFASELSLVTGCEVLAAHGKSSTAHRDGKKGTYTDPWRAEQQWDRYLRGKRFPTNQQYIKPTAAWGPAAPAPSTGKKSRNWLPAALLIGGGLVLLALLGGGGRSYDGQYSIVDTGSCTDGQFGKGLAPVDLDGTVVSKNTVINLYGPNVAIVDGKASLDMDLGSGRQIADFTFSTDGSVSGVWRSLGPRRGCSGDFSGRRN